MYFQKRVLLWVGARSYAMYLCHIPAFFATREIMHRLHPGTRFGPEDFWVFIAVATGLVVLCSELNYRLLETPLRRRGRRIARELLARRRAAVAEQI